MRAAVGRPLASQRYEHTELTLDDLEAWCLAPEAGPKDMTRVPGLLMGSLTADGPRRASTVVSRSAVVLDCDGGAVADLPARVAAALPGTEALLWRTASSTPDDPRWRVVIPLARDVSAVRYPLVGRAVADLLPGVPWDQTCHQAERAVLVPLSATGEPVAYERIPGVPLDPEMLPSAPADPVPSAGKAPSARRDPRTIPGAVGAFNRAFDLARAAEAFDLPYAPTDDPAMWRHVEASGAGLHEVAPGLWHDFHASSPTHGQTLSTFDLVREHLYGSQGPLELDLGVPEGTPVQSLPSHEAMLQHAAGLPDVQTEMAREMLAPIDDAAPAPAVATAAPAAEPAPAAPAATFTVEACEAACEPRSPRAGTRRVDHPRTAAAIAGLDPLMATLGRSVLTGAIGWSEPPPWREGDAQALALLRRTGVAPLEDGDMAHVQQHLARTYAGAGVPEAHARLIIGLAADAPGRRVDPLTEYLDRLEWDGVSRIDSALPGTQDDPWARLAVRRSMIAAVARAFDPGCQVDTSLVLVGPQGTRKSSWVRWLAGPFTVGLGPVGEKDTLIEAHGAWIVEADEGFRTARMGARDADRLKSFLTTRIDTFRLPYGRSAVTRARRFVVWGTTNDEEMLSRDEGTRRWWPVRVDQEIDAADMTDERRDALWAEAVHLYRSGEPWWMADAESAALAESAAQAYVEDDPLESAVREYLDAPRPEGWAEMTEAARRRHMDAVEAGLEQPGGAPVDAVRMDHVLADALRVPADRRGQRVMKQVAGAMRALGWTRRVVHHEGGGATRMWVRPTGGATWG